MDNLHRTLILSISGVATLIASVLSAHAIQQHLNHYHVPKIQRPVIRILWMVPIYAIDSFLSLCFTGMSIYFDTIRDCYEAYVLYNFFALLNAYLDDFDEDVLDSMSMFSHPFPFCCLPKFKPGRELVQWCKRFVLQFIVLKPILAAISLGLEMFDLYDDGSLRFDRGYLYIAIITNISISLSLYYLAIFFIMTEELLREYNPLQQFMCIKASIFFSFWQGLAFVVFTKIGIIHDTHSFSADHIALTLQDFLICIEMCFLAYYQRSIFGLSMSVLQKRMPSSEIAIEMQPIPRNQDERTKAALLDVVDMSDIVVDIESSLKTVKDKHTKEV